jgi:D-alanine transaminase
MSAITLPDLALGRRDIKSVNLLPNVLARQAAREQGAARRSCSTSDRGW